MTNLDLSDQETATLLREVDRIIDGDRYPFSPRIRMLKGIRAKIRPYSERPHLPPTKYYRHLKGPIPETLLKTCTNYPMTLGGAAAVHLRLIVRCRNCRRQVEPDPAEMGERYGTATTAPDSNNRLVCSRCSSRNVNKVATGNQAAVVGNSVECAYRWRMKSCLPQQKREAIRRRDRDDEPARETAHSSNVSHSTISWP